VLSLCGVHSLIVDPARSPDDFDMAPINPPFRKPIPKKPSQPPQTQAGPSSRPEEEKFNSKGPKSRVDHSYINMAAGPNTKFKRPTFSNGQTTGSNPTRSINTTGPSSIGHGDSRSSSNNHAHHFRASLPAPPSGPHNRPFTSMSEDYVSLADEDFLDFAEQVDPVPSVAIAPVRRSEEDVDQSLLSSPLSLVDSSM
jgi:hypothetical protein